MKNIKRFEERFEDIVDWSNTIEYRKDERLAELMTDIEKMFHIPMMNDEDYYKANPEVITSYRKISDVRTIL